MSSTTPLASRSPAVSEPEMFLRPAVDPWALLGTVGGDVPHIALRVPGEPVLLGLGVAAAITGVNVLQSGQDRLASELAARGLLHDAAAFLACTFDPEQPFGPPGSEDPAWQGYAAVTLWAPEVLCELSATGTRVRLTAPPERHAALLAEVDALLGAALAGAGSVRPVADLVVEWADGAHHTNVEAALAALAARAPGADPALDKVVLAHAVEVLSTRPFATGDLLARLAGAHPRAYLFCYRPAPGASVFLGASPERLARVEGGRVSSGALAGSAPRGADADEDARFGAELLASAKDLEEHDIVGDMITDALAPLCREVHRGGAPQLERLPTVQHLFTPIEGTLRPGYSILDVVAALHPTPAVGGMPRPAALAAIRSLEAVPRGLYAGALGRVSLATGDGDIAVAIRSALVDGARARLFAGGGIVPGSDPDAEVAETRLKLAAMLNALAPPLPGAEAVVIVGRDG